MKILFLTNIPSPYRVDFFNELGKLCDLTVLFERDSSEERDDSWKSNSFNSFKGVVLSGKKFSVDKAICFDVRNWLKDNNFDNIIIGNALTPTGMIAIQYMKHNHIKYWIESDGGFPKNGKSLKEHIKKYFIKGAYGYLSTSEIHDSYYTKYGAEKDRIFRYPFTSLKEEDILVKPIESAEKQALKLKLGISEKNLIVSVGQMIYRKGFDILLNSALKINSDTAIYIIGGKPTNEYESIILKNHLINVHFLDFMLKPQLREYYMAADLFVLPTREDIWGLVINEAMACGTPVITTNKCIAGLELIENGKNGYIIPTENSDKLAEKINFICNNKELQNQMSFSSLEKIKNYTVENMAKSHIDILIKENAE